MTDSTKPLSLSLKQVVARRDRYHAAINRIVSETCELLSASDASLWDVEEESQTLMPVASARSPETAWDKMRVRIDASVVGMVAATGVPTLVSPDERVVSVVGRVSGINTKWMVAAPVRVRDETEAILTAIQSDESIPFTERDLAALVWRAELLGMVITCAVLDSHA